LLRAAIVAGGVVMVVACTTEGRPAGWRDDAFGNSVKPIDAFSQSRPVRYPDRFVFDFKRASIGVKGAPSVEVVERYLMEHPELIPAECKNGVVVSRAGAMENGYGFAVFACR